MGKIVRQSQQLGGVRDDAVKVKTVDKLRDNKKNSVCRAGDRGEKKKREVTHGVTPSSPPAMSKE